MMRMKKMVMMIPGPPSRLKLEVASYDHDGEEEQRKRMIMMMMTMLTVIMTITLMMMMIMMMTSFKAREYHSSKHEVASHYERDAHCAETKHRTLPVSKMYFSTILQESY